MATNDPNSPYWDGSSEGLFGDLYGNQGVEAKDAGDMVGNRPIQTPYPQKSTFDWATNLNNSDEGTSFSNSSGSSPYGYDAGLYDQGGFDNAWDSSGSSPLGSSLSGGYEYGSSGNPFSYDLGSGTSTGYSSYTDPSSDGMYSMSSADNRSALNRSESAYSKPGEEDNFLKKYKNAVSPFQGLLKNPIISTLMSLHPGTAVLKSLLGGPNSVGGFLGSMFSSNPIGKIAGALGGSQLANYATEGQFAPMNAGQIGSIAGGVAGGYTGNPYAQLAGGYLGGKASDQGQSWGANDFGGPMGGGQGFSNMVGTGLNGTLGGTLANLGMGYNNNRTIGNQINSLEGLYGQNSSYATAMREQLNRRDAAAGRRSQYGPREVELQALLAGNAAKLQPGLQQLYSQKMGNTNLLVQSLMRNPNALKQGWDGLSALFNPGNGRGPINAPEPDNSGFEFTGGGA